MKKTKKINIDKLLEKYRNVDTFGNIQFEIETKPKHDNFPIYILCAGTDFWNFGGCQEIRTLVR
jgi:hypothetical protein